MATKFRVEGHPSADDADFARVPKQPRWQISIFAFTTKKHLLILFPAILLATVAGAIRPVLAIFLGYIFDELLSFGAGDSTESDLLHNVSTWTVAITGVGVATFLTNGAFFSLWLIFGEMQARSVRDMAFVSMLGKEMDWYDLRTDGIGSLLIRIQT
jgi:ATP-binding cassette, subfamily B (MDR/TAP), member 1